MKAINNHPLTRAERHLLIEFLSTAAGQPRPLLEASLSTPCDTLLNCEYCVYFFGALVLLGEDQMWLLAPGLLRQLLYEFAGYRQVTLRPPSWPGGSWLYVE